MRFPVAFTAIIDADSDMEILSGRFKGQSVCMCPSCRRDYEKVFGEYPKVGVKFRITYTKNPRGKLLLDSNGNLMNRKSSESAYVCLFDRRGEGDDITLKRTLVRLNKGGKK